MKILILALLLIATSAQADNVLTWDDSSVIEDGFEIQQNGPGGWTVIIRVGPDVTTYVDAASDEGVYRVRAFITVDEVDIFSGYAKGGKVNGPITLLVQ